MINDIYITVNSNVKNRVFLEKLSITKDNINIRKIYDEELHKYLVNKLESDNENYKKASMNDAVDLLLAMFANRSDDREDVINQTIFSILDIVSFTQGKSVVWEIGSSEELITKPLISFDEDGWDTLVTHMDTEPLLTFNHVFDFFMNEYSSKYDTPVLKKGVLEDI